MRSRHQGLDTKSSLRQPTLNESAFNFLSERRGSACRRFQSTIQHRRKRLRRSNLFNPRTDLSHSFAGYVVLLPDRFERSRWLPVPPEMAYDDSGISVAAKPIGQTP